MLDELREAASQARHAFELYIWDRDPDWYNSSYVAHEIEGAFLRMLVALEMLGLDSLRDMLLRDINEAKSSDDGFAKSKTGPLDGALLAVPLSDRNHRPTCG
jgi:hypothetical protein